MPRLKNPSHQLSLESGVNNPFNQSGLQPLNLSNQPSVRSSAGLKSPNLFNLSSVQYGLNLRRELIDRVLSARRRPKLNPPFYQSSVRSSLDLFNQSSLDPSYQSSAQSSPSVEPPNLFYRSCFESSLSLFYQSSLESGANNPFNRYSLKPPNLFIQSSVQSRPSLKSLDPFNQSRLEPLNPST